MWGYILLKQEIYLWKSLFRNIFPQKDFLPRFLFEKYKYSKNYERID